MRSAHAHADPRAGVGTRLGRGADEGRRTRRREGRRGAGRGASTEHTHALLVSDVDVAIERAEEVQAETVERMEQEGVDAAGDTGESDPLLAIQDALQTFPADEIVLFTHAAGDLNWLEEGVLEEARERFEIPVNHLIVESA